MNKKSDFSNINQQSPETGTIITEDISLSPADLEKTLATSLPVLPLREIVIFPEQAVPVPVGRESSLKLLEECVDKHSLFVALTQTDPAVNSPRSKDLFKIGTLCKVIRTMSHPTGATTAFVISVCRVEVSRFTSSNPYLKAKFQLVGEQKIEKPSLKDAAAIVTLNEAVNKMFEAMGPDENKDFKFAVSQIEDPARRISFIAMHSPISFEDKQTILEIDSISERAIQLTAMILKAIEFISIRREMQTRTQTEISQMQRQQFLEQQIKVMQDELNGGEDDDISQLYVRAEALVWSEDMQQRFEKEIRRLQRFNPQSPDYAIQYAYLDNILSLPWENYAPAEFSMQKVEEILNRDHYGLKKVKDRIMEQMAVFKQRGDVKSGIICLYGPPGVGKTSLGKSVAEALGREYARVSFGGLHDEAEIRGHRKTYLGAMPGRIIAALQKCKTGNPVFVLDEIDKIGQDFKGDPSTALLEVLDPAQNDKFHDNYIDVDYDLSKVLFIATANTLSTISAPLLDRMELIEVSGYIAEEKVEIALRHLIPTLLEEAGLEKDALSFTREALRCIIDDYTRESGVRQLSKKIAKIIRKIVLLKVSEMQYPVTVTPDEVKHFLGKKEVFSEIYENNDFTGVVTGLAWTSAGGEILFIESSLSHGKGEKLTLTGNLGDVMKESAILALQYLKAHAGELGIDPEDFGKYDVHIHVPEGAIPKDGPSAGVTMTTSLASSFTGRKVKEKLAMTGEITLRGKVLPVGGIKEKILAAKRAGITDIMLCSQNRKDIEEIDNIYLEGLTFHYVDTIKQVLDYALL